MTFFQALTSLIPDSNLTIRNHAGDYNVPKSPIHLVKSRVHILDMESGIPTGEVREGIRDLQCTMIAPAYSYEYIKNLAREWARRAAEAKGEEFVASEYVDPPVEELVPLMYAYLPAKLNNSDKRSLKVFDVFGNWKDYSSENLGVIEALQWAGSGNWCLLYFEEQINYGKIQSGGAYESLVTTKHPRDLIDKSKFPSILNGFVEEKLTHERIV